MITAIVTSDNHLGVYYARMRPEMLEKRRRRLQAAFERVVDAAIARRVDLFLHAGDLFDRPDPRNVERLMVAQQARRLQEAGIPFFAIAGNHDRPRSLGPDGAFPHQEMAALDAIRLFPRSDAFEPLELNIRGTRVAIQGMSADFNRPPGECPLEGVAQHRAGDIDVVLLHYGVEGWAPGQGSEPRLSLRNLGRLETDAICVGHLHQRNQRRLPGGAVLLNPGATEHIHFGEESLDCGFWILNLSPGRAETEYAPFPAQPMRTIHVDLTPISGMEGVTDRALARLAEVSAADQLLRVRLGGRLTREKFHELDLTAIQEAGSRANFYCQVETPDLALVDALSDVPLGYGVSFDVAQELQRVVREILEFYEDDPVESEICRRAGIELSESCERLSGRGM